MQYDDSVNLFLLPMKRNIFLIPVFSLLFICDIFGQITFQKTYGFVGVNYGSSIQLTNDGGYIFLSNDSINTNNYDINLIKINSIGDTLWTRTYGGVGIDIGCAVRQTSDNGYIISGYTNSFGTDSSGVYLIKTNNLGTEIWSKTFHKTQYGNWGLSILQTNEGGYLIGGVSYNPSFSHPNSRNCYLIKTDNNGNLLWDRVIGDYAVCKCVNKTNDGGFVITGFIAYSENPIVWEAFLFKTDSNGNILWRKTFRSIDDTEGEFVQQTSDSGFIMTGITQNFGAGGNDVLLVKTNSIGDTLWTKTYGGIGNEVGYSILQTSDGSYIITGVTSSFGSGDYGMYLIKTDSNGDTLWTKTYGGTGRDVGFSAIQCTDGGYIINGYTNSFGDNHYRYYLIKTDSSGNSGCNESSTGTIVNSTSLSLGNDVSPISFGTTVFSTVTIVGSGITENTICTTASLKEISKINSFGIFPNPSSGIFRIITSNNIEKSVVEVYNTLGEIIFKDNFDNKEEIEINLANYTNGIYFLQLINERKRLTSKIILQHN
jgi:hypothetical protein